MTCVAQPSRHVSRLRLRASSADHARHAAILFEDALRTASLPDAERSCLVLIRRLNLGRLPARAGAVDFARRLEQAAREAASGAVPATSPAANTAQAVCFRDRSEALTLLARRLARRAAADEWFWPAALPGWRADLDRPTQWLTLLRIAEGLPEFALAAAAVGREALIGGDCSEMMSGLPTGIGAHWLRLAGFQLPTHDWARSQSRVESFAPETGGETAEHRKESKLFTRDSPLVAPLVRFHQTAKSTDDRVLWLITLAAVAEDPLRAADASLPARAALWWQRVQQLRGAVKVAADADERRTATSGARRAARVASDAGTERASTKGDADSVSTHAELGLIEAASEIPSSPAPVVTCELEFTMHGGLLFLIPVLQRLGLPEFLAERAARLEAGFGAALLLAFGVRVGLCATDPLARALASVDEQDPKSWGFSGDGFDPWITATRRWCRRQARIGLHSLIVRPGRLAATSTHLDLAFALRESDVRVRRAGLDLDPGWVPWLGRVVRFHYEDSDGH